MPEEKQKLNLKEYQELCKTTASALFENKEQEIADWGLGVAGGAGDLARKPFSTTKRLKARHPGEHW